MGSCFSSDAANADAKKEESKTSSPPDEAPAEAEKPKPMLFAIMRNGHEVIRGGMRDLTSAIERSVDLGLVARQWKDLLKWTELHAAMEEGTGIKGETPKGFFWYVQKILGFQLYSRMTRSSLITIVDLSRSLFA